MEIIGYEKAAGKGWFVELYNDGSKSAAFKNKGDLGKKMYTKMEVSGKVPAEYVAPPPKLLHWKARRRQAFIDQNLTHDDWTELDMDNLTTAKSEFRAKRAQIKLDIPKDD